MHIFTKRMASIAASAVMAVCTLNVFPAFSAEDGKITIHFEYADPAISIVEDDDGNIPEINDITSDSVASVKLPSASLKKDGYVFQGWTADGVYGYESGSILRTAGEDITLTPVFSIYKDKTVYTGVYQVDFGDGNGIIDTSKELKNVVAHPNEFVKLSFMSYQNEYKKSTGWTDGEHNFLQEQLLIMPEHDFILTPIWHNRLTLTYYAGDYDGITGATTAEFDVIETQKKDIADGTRFARKGYEIDHWHCDYDDKDYAFLSSFVMPDVNVTMTAVWRPIEYTVVFRTGISGVSNLKVKGKTGDTITVPTLDATREGYTFGGWTYEDKTYQSGDDFLVEGAAPGLGIALSPVWYAEGEEPQVTTTVAETTTSTTAPAETTTTTLAETTTTKAAETTTVAETTTTKAADTTSTSTTADTTTTTAPVTTIGEKNYFKIEVVNENGDLVNDTVIQFSHHISITLDSGDSISTGPIKTIDTSVQNPLLISRSSDKNSVDYLSHFSIIKKDSDSLSMIAESDIKITEDKANNVIVYRITVKDAKSIVYGDANCDGKVDISDAVLIMQSLSNPSKYKLTDVGKKNADVAGDGDGITNNDALAIQKFMLKLIDKLPEVAETK